MNIRPWPILPLFFSIAFLVACETSRPTPNQDPPEPSVRPQVNAEYLTPDLKVSEWVQRLENESREVYDLRREIIAAAHIRPGMIVADVGAGTGLFTPLLADAVGPKGKVYAVDIVPKFLELISERVSAAGIENVQTVLCTERSIELPANSIDLAFICDAYHHFEYPRSTLTSLYQALRPGGQVFLVDFKRIPGVSPDWIIGHVRAGQETVTEEIKNAGFEPVEELNLLKDNYILLFRKGRR